MPIFKVVLLFSPEPTATVAVAPSPTVSVGDKSAVAVGSGLNEGGLKPALPPDQPHPASFGTLIMDKKAKKRIDVLNTRITTLRQQLAGARKQMDDADEVKNLEKQLAAAEAELAKFKE